MQGEPDLLSQPWSVSMKAPLEEAIQVGFIHKNHQNENIQIKLCT
jgi:hypothetical protein